MHIQTTKYGIPKTNFSSPEVWRGGRWKSVNPSKQRFFIRNCAWKDKKPCTRKAARAVSKLQDKPQHNFLEITT
jgi:hypothetical protein